MHEHKWFHIVQKIYKLINESAINMFEKKRHRNIEKIHIIIIQLFYGI